MVIPNTCKEFELTLANSKEKLKFNISTYTYIDRDSGKEITKKVLIVTQFDPNTQNYKEVYSRHLELDKTSVTIGRNSENTIVTNQSETVVSRNHINMQYSTEGFVITDTSSFGSKVNIPY